jgi:serine/threonine protein kinase
MEHCDGGSLRQIINDDDESDISMCEIDEIGNQTFGSLNNILGNKALFKRKYNTEKHFKKILRKLLYDVKFLHDIGIAHRDLKLDNIMITSKDTPNNSSLGIRIIDFGLSK